MAATAEILETTARAPLHERVPEDLADAWVSSQSRWTDATWVLDNPTPGARPASSTFRWHVALPDGRSLTDPVHRELLDWLKRLTWSLYAAPGDNAKPLKPGSAAKLRTGVQYFSAWMVDTGRVRPSDLDEQACVDFVDDLKTGRLLDDDADDDDETGVSFKAIETRAQIPVLAWRQRAALRAAGIAPPPREPFHGRAASAIAKEVTTDRPGWWPPLPDEIALHVMNAAWDFLGTPAEDILALHDAYRGEYNRNPRDHQQRRHQRARQVAEAFQFQCRPGQTEPWHAPLSETSERHPKTVTHKDIKRTAGKVRRLVQDLTHACCLVIQATTGMRISEVCGLPAGIDPETGLPMCVSVEDSASGLNDLYVVHTRLAKTEDSPRSVDWVLGMRPKQRGDDTNDLPPAVRALHILNNLLAPYRELRGTNDLFVALKNRLGLPQTSRLVGPVQANSLQQGMRDFVARYVDWSALPDESRHAFETNDLVKYKESVGRIIKTHQWRKSFANFTVRVDPGLLPTLQMHFQHVSLAMTEGGYVGRDPSLLSEVEGARDQATALAMWEIAQGKASLENMGKAGTRLSQAVTDNLVPRVEGQPESVAWRETVRFTDELGATFAFSPYATCAAYLLSEMRCHQEAGTTVLARWRHNLQPNFEHRRPSLCAGCPNAIFDKRHRPFWISRYTENRRALLDLEKQGERAGHRVFEAKAAQARNVLRQIGEDVDALDTEIDAGRNPAAEMSDA